MKTKRTYLTVPGQSLTITIEGPMGSGKTQVGDRIVKMFQEDGLFAVASAEFSGAERVTAKCPTEREARDLYLDALDEHQRATLRGHLDALGYEL